MNASGTTAASRMLRWVGLGASNDAVARAATNAGPFKLIVIKH